MAKNGKRLTDKKYNGTKPLTNEQSKAKSLLIPQEYKGNPYITFSFRYFAQQQYFGIGDQDAPWFANLFDRVKDLSGKTKSILENQKEREDYRLHPIDWTAKNCPITIDDLVSVPKAIKDNAEDDFFWQFQLSKGTGRVVGFFNEDFSIFYIVLLDPKHNIQPSKDYGFSVDETTIATTEYERIQMCIADAVRGTENCLPENRKKCPLPKLNDEYLRSDVFYARIDPDLKEQYKDLIESGDFQIKFEEFLLSQLK